MDVKFVNPFLTSLLNVLSTMANIQAKPGKPALKSNSQAKGDVSGIMGMASQRVKGSISITFTKEVALNICTNMLGETPDGISEEVLDLTGEITNMVTGGAKKLLAESGLNFDMATPTVVHGEGHQVHHKANAEIIIVPFTSDAGDFFVEVCFEGV